jgi:hypothetical protein
MAENRLTREVETRESAQRAKAWAPPTLLPDPTPQPGWAFKYIRISAMGQGDPTNTSAKFREGWEPVKAVDHPEIMYFAENNPNSRFKDGIEIGGLLLCKAPIEMVNQRKEYFQRMNQSQMEAVDQNFMRQRDEKTNMSLFSEKKSTTTFGRGNKF